MDENASATMRIAVLFTDGDVAYPAMLTQGYNRECDYANCQDLFELSTMKRSRT